MNYEIDERSKGITFSLTANVFFSLMVIQLGYLHHSSTSTSVLSRFGIGLIIMVGGAILGKWKLNGVNFPLLAIRGILGGISMIFAFLALKNLGIGRSTMIFHTYPIFTALMAMALLGEQISIRKVISFGLAFIGMFILMGKSIAGGDTLIWDLSALAGAAISGLIIVIIRKLHETDSSTSIFLAQCVAGVLIVLYPGVKGFGAIPISELALLTGMGICATAGQLFMTNGFKYLTATTGSLLGMAVPVVNLILGAVLFGEAMGIREIGALLFIGGATLVLITGD